MKTFVVEYGIICNHSPVTTDTYTIRAKNFESAKKKAKRLARAIELVTKCNCPPEIAEQHEDDDWWADPINIFEIEPVDEPLPTTTKNALPF